MLGLFAPCYSDKPLTSWFELFEMQPSVGQHFSTGSAKLDRIVVFLMLSVALVSFIRCYEVFCAVLAINRVLIPKPVMVLAILPQLTLL